MTRTTRISCAFLLAALTLGMTVGCGTDSLSEIDGGPDGGTDAGSDGGGDVDLPNADGVWCDDVSGLCWQDPPSESSVNWEDTTATCDSLALGGVGGWRVPSISELRSLIRDCPNTGTGGACAVTDDCLSSTCWDSSCDGCDGFLGPGTGGCYWDPALGGLCEVYWSSSTSPEGSSSTWAWRVNFGGGGVWQVGTPGEKGIGTYVRCVHDAP
jgi:hypothetical protein